MPSRCQGESLARRQTVAKKNLVWRRPSPRRQTPKDQIEALDKWKAAFPKSDYADEREEQYLFVYEAAKMNRQAIDKAVEILKTRPNQFNALYAILTLVQGLMPPTPADLDAAARTAMYVEDNLDAIFADANRPANIPDSQLGDDQTGSERRRP